MLQLQGRLDEATTCYRRALELKPDYPEAYSNLGYLLKDQGQFDEAEACYRRALDLKPDFADGHLNLGILRREQGRMDEAVACFRRAVEIKPDQIAALNSLASYFLEQSDPMTGLTCVIRSLCFKQNALAKGLFVECIKRCQFHQVDDLVQQMLVRALSEPWGRPSGLTGVMPTSLSSTQASAPV